MTRSLASARYMSFESRKSDGTMVATPVWLVPFEDGYAFTTEPDSHKVRRIARDPSVVVTACDIRGRTTADAIRFEGVAHLLDEHSTEQVERLIARKYFIGVRLLGIISIVKRLMGKGSTVGDAAIKVVVTPT